MSDLVCALLFRVNLLTSEEKKTVIRAVGVTADLGALEFSRTTTEAYMRKTLAVAVVCLVAWVLGRPGTMPARNIGSCFTDPGLFL